jgi:glutaredoxin 2
MHPSLPRNAPKAVTNSHSIKLKLRDVSQLFNSMDPSPFIEKDLDDEAEEFIVSWAEEFSPHARLDLRVYLERWPEQDPTELIRQAVHNYFTYRAELTNLEFKHLMKQGRTSLFIGLSFLAACLAVLETLLRGDQGTWAGVLRESLTIAGWVAMWRPMQIYLYDWWPLQRRGRIYAKLSQIPIEVVREE